MEESGYVDAGGTQIAYRTVHGGDGPDVVVVAGVFFPFEALLEDRVYRRFLEGLSGLGRVVCFDKRGVGLSDPIADWDRPPAEQWADDLVSVVEALGLEAPTVVSWDPFGAARAAVARRPELFGRLVLLNPDRSMAGIARRVSGSVLSTVEDIAFPSRIGDPAFRAWIERAGRFGSSPGAAERTWRAMVGVGDELTPPGIDVPTLILHRTGSMVSRISVDAVAAAIAGAVVVGVDGDDVFPIAGDVDAVVAEISRFVTGDAALPPPERAVGAVLFSDLVGSTDQAVGAGDDRWRALLDDHDGAVRTLVERASGRVVKFTGDGVLALLPSARAAVVVATSIRDHLVGLGLSVRMGVHVGDVDRRGDDVSGITVTVAARIMGRAAAGEVLLSESTRLALLGSGIDVEAADEVELKGVPERWRLHRLV